MEGVLKISEAANLGVHAMVYLLEAGLERTIAVAEIAGVLGVSKDHLGKVLQRLAKAGLVTSRRGPRGGFRLNDGAGEATLLEILEAIDGPMANETCLFGHPICGGRCIMGGLMISVNQMVHDYLSTTRLSDMAVLSPLARRLRQEQSG